LRLKQAELVLVIPDSEPIKVDVRSVSRDAPVLLAHLQKTTASSTQSSAKARLNAKISKTGVGAAVEASASVGGENRSLAKLELSSETNFLRVIQSKTEKDEYRWMISPADKSYLVGRPWDASSAPRLKLIDKRKDRSKDIPPVVSLEIRCKREDLDIREISLKDRGKWKAIKRHLGLSNKLAAAEAYIRDKLSEEGLEVKELNDSFGQLTVASVIAEPTADQ
jgi:hypothetical protein